MCHEKRLSFIELLRKTIGIETNEYFKNNRMTYYLRNILSNPKLKSELIQCTSYLDINCNSSERLYHIFNNIYVENPVNCLVCNEPTVFFSYNKGYNLYCSNSCRHKDSKNINKKAFNTYKDKTGFDNPSQNPQVKEKKKETCVFSNTEKMQEIRSNNKEKTGYYFCSQDPVIKQKIKDSYFEKTGFENPSLNPDVIQKRKQTSLTNCGFESNLQDPEFRKKIEERRLIDTGYSNPAQNPEIKQKIRNSFNKQFLDKLLNSDRLKQHYIPLFTVDDYNGVCDKNKYRWKCVKCNTEFFDTIDDGKIPRCPKCYPFGNFSFIENNLSKYCEQFGNIIRNNRKIINPYEIDIFYPDKQLGIELNGLYWHGELSRQRTKEYHQIKLKKCLEQKIKLLQFFDDEWINKQSIVQSMIMSKLGNIKYKVPARKCKIMQIDNSSTNTFLDEHHLQGKIIGSSFNYALFYNDYLVSVLSIGNPRFSKNHEYEIYRYSNYKFSTIVGGFSKLLKYFIKIHNPRSIITYADARYGFGEVYHVSGFKYLGISNPGYFYTKDYKTRLSRFLFMKNKLSSKLPIFDDNLSEWDNMQLNNYDRIWDCGNFVYDMKL